jgi:hypothetical protein
LFGRGGEIRTHDPLRPRRFSNASDIGLFPTTSVSSSWWPSCCAVWNGLEAGGV